MHSINVRRFIPWRPLRWHIVGCSCCSTGGTLSIAPLGSSAPLSVAFSPRSSGHWHTPPGMAAGKKSGGGAGR